jgi:hypothetical protein
MEYTAIHGGVIRRVWPTDLPSFPERPLRLDGQSRFGRFAMTVDHAFLIRRPERRFGISDVIHGYHVDGIIRDVGELRAIG